jgi:hypothetical protein
MDIKPDNIFISYYKVFISFKKVQGIGEEFDKKKLVRAFKKVTR